MEREPLPDVKKIAILRALVLGDLIFSLPALDALHKTYPDAEITYLGRPWHTQFLPERIPGITQVCGFNPSSEPYEDLGYLIHEEEASLLFDLMRKAKFDLGIQMQGGGKNSNPFIKRLEPRISIGSREDGAIPLEHCVPYIYQQNEVIRQLEIVGLAGAKTTEIHPKLAVLETDRAAAEPFLKQIKRPYVILHAGARDIRRCWSPLKYAQIGDAIRKQWGLEVVLTGQSDVADDSAQIIMQQMEQPVINLSGQLALPALTGLIANTELMISNDTGPMHLALAVGSKAVGLYWVEYLIKSLPMQRTTFRPVISWERHCPLCGTFMTHFEVISCDPRPCMHEVTFLDSIQTEEVLQAAQDLLSFENFGKQAG